jgi:hypothetical protein
MPNYFVLYRKSDVECACGIGHAQPQVFQQIDIEMCQYFGVDVHEKYYFCGWYDYIGYLLATGRSFADIEQLILKNLFERKSVGDSRHAKQEREWSAEMLQVNNWLRERFTTDAWYSPYKG